MKKYRTIIALLLIGTVFAGTQVFAQSYDEVVITETDDIGFSAFMTSLRDLDSSKERALKQQLSNTTKTSSSHIAYNDTQYVVGNGIVYRNQRNDSKTSYVNGLYDENPSYFGTASAVGTSRTISWWYWFLVLGMIGLIIFLAQTTWIRIWSDDYHHYRAYKRALRHEYRVRKRIR